MCSGRSCAHKTECLICQLACLFSKSQSGIRVFSTYIRASALFWKSHFKRLCEMNFPILNWAHSCIKIACYKLSHHTFLPFLLLLLFLFHSSSLSEREEIYVPSRHNKKERKWRAGKTWAGQTLSFCCTFWVSVSMNQIIIEAAITQAKQTGMWTFLDLAGNNSEPLTRLCMFHKHVLWQRTLWFPNPFVTIIIITDGTETVLY